MKIINLFFTTAIASSLLSFTYALSAKAEQHETSPKVEYPVDNEVPHSQIHISPNESALKAMQTLPIDEPIYMLNMIRLKDKADYEQDSEFASKGWTGAQAYAKYRHHAGAIVARLGGKSIYEGAAQLTLIGPKQEQWDSIFIIYYPNVAALQSLIQDPEYQKHAFHRRAGVADSRLIRMSDVR